MATHNDEIFLGFHRTKMQAVVITVPTMVHKRLQIGDSIQVRYLATEPTMSQVEWE